MLQDKIKSLIHIIEGTEINEIEVSSFWGAQKIRLQKNHNLDIQTTVQSTENTAQQTPSNVTSALKPIQVNPEPLSSEDTEVESVSPSSIEIIAPLVGTYYQSAKPGAPAFVKEGDTIQVGQIICIIEAMKIFNEIEAEVSGKVLKVIVNDSSPVEYGQALMLVEPS